MPSATPAPARLPVWDAPVRLFHWALAVLVVFSFVTGKIAGEWLVWHMRSGYAILTLLLFRLAWGLFGGTTARFSDFLRPPAVAVAYLREALALRIRHSVGHNPAGGWFVVLMLVAVLVQAVSGLFVDDEIATQGPLTGKVSNAVVARMTQLHGVNEWVVLAAVVIHVAAIAFYQWRVRLDLIGPMVHGGAVTGIEGHKPGSNALAAVLFAAACAAVYWLVVVYPRAAS